MKNTPPPLFTHFIRPSGHRHSTPTLSRSGLATVFSIKAVLQDAKNRLKDNSDSALLDAELLLAYCLEKNRTYLHTWPERIIEQSQLNCYHALIEKRLTDYPVAYLLGHKEFWTLDLLVTPDVLIPRPETELLVEIALDKIKSIKNPKILDLGTGSGAIALALASERPDARIVATDNSSKALKIASSNAVKHKLTNQLNFIKSDWFSNIEKIEFDLIVSNPPYISPDDPHLLQTIRYEPQQALASNNKGMEDIEDIIKNSPPFLKEGSWLILEHGYNQSSQTLEIFTNNNFTCEKTFADLNDNQRVTLARLKA